MDSSTAAPTSARPPRAHALCEYALLAAILLLGGYLRFSTAYYHKVPCGDEGSFINLAANLAGGRGFTTSVVWHWFGVNESFPVHEDARSPLVPLVYAGLFLVTGVSFRVAQLVNVLAGCATVFLVYLLGRRLHGAAAGLLGAFMLAVCWPHIRYSAFVYAEAMFAFLVMIALLLLERLKDTRRPRQAGLVFGALLGLAFLCRANGIFLLPAALVIAWFVRRDTVVWIVTAFAALASPWMIRNVIVFGKPLYGYYSYFFWVDNVSEMWHRIRDTVPSAHEFFQKHGLIAGTIGRLGAGTRDVLKELWEFEAINLPLAKMAFPFGIYFVVSGWHRRIIWAFLGLFFLLSLLPTIWLAAVVWICRYFLVFYPPYFIACAVGAVALTGTYVRFPPARIVVLFALAAVLGASMYYPLEYLTSRRNGDRGGFASHNARAAILARELPAEAIILTGSLAQMQYAIGRRMISYPIHEEPRRVIAFARAHGATHFAVDHSLLAADGLADYLGFSSNRSGTRIRPAPWQLMLAGNGLWVYDLRHQESDVAEIPQPGETHAQ